MSEPSKNLFPLQPVLVVDDEPHALRSMEMLLKSAGINNIFSCADGREVTKIIEQQEPELMLLDIIMPHVSGENILESVKAWKPQIPIIMITGADDLEQAVNCMRAGAFDYIVKPVNKERLISSVRHAMELRTLRRETGRLKEHILSGSLQHPEAFAEFDSVNPKLRSVFQYVEAIADSSEPVLITGETGVGKELMARAVYAVGKTRGEFVSVNVAGLDEQAFSDTLFGHTKGAFTGALEIRKGLIEKAHDGVIFLDEIGDLSSSLQIKLLRVLQEREYFPLGADVARHNSARVIVATNKNVDELRQTGKFRDDFYFRLCHHHVQIPPLRERLDDLPLLINKFVDQAAKKINKPKPDIPDQLVLLLHQYDFPGNVRELQAMISDAVSRHETGSLPLRHFSDWMKAHTVQTGNFQEKTGPDSHIRDNISASQKISFGAGLPTLKTAQNILIAEAMRRADNNQALAAQMLGISRQALNRRLLDCKKSSTRTQEQ